MSGPARLRQAARLRAEALEQRLLHSADLAPLALAGGVLLQQSMADAGQVAEPAAARSEIVFVDAGVADADLLLADLRAQQAAGRPVEIVTIDADADGIAVIGDTLASRHDIAALHLVSHGSSGAVRLGATVLDGQALLQRAGEIAAWSSALDADADLLLYGCDVAADAAGERFVQDLALVTGADVAASCDLTGAAAAGGNWTLEDSTGRIESSPVIGTAAQAAWQGTLNTYTVTTRSDLLGSLLPGSLRWAISQANANVGADTIVFAADGVFQISALSSGDDNNASGDFDIKDDVTIVGNGSGDTVIRGNGLDRVFDLRGAALTMSGLTIEGGASSNGGGLRIDSASRATLTDVVVQDNVGHGGTKGAGIMNDGALTLRRVIVQNNGDTGSGDADGGGIYVDNGAVLDARDVEVRGNVADGKDGGGIYLGDATATLVNVTLAGNTAKRGGGLWSHGNGATLTNVTISGNTAADAGGGLWADRALALERVTVAGNSALASHGGGIFDKNGDVSVHNTLLAANTGGNTNRALASLGFNLSDDASPGFTATGDRSGTAASLSALSGNGGFTRTQAIAAGSAARDAADPGGAPGTDQRGLTTYGARADIGAFEYNPFGAAPTVSAIAAQAIDEDQVLGPIAFTLADLETAAGALSVGVSSSNPALAAASGLMLGGSGANRTLTITPVADANSSASGGPATITITVSDGGNSTSTSFTLDVRALNDAPTFTRPATASVAEDEVLALTGANTVAMADVDAGSTSLQLALAVAHGQLALTQTTGLAFVSGSAAGSATMSFIGTLQAIDDALATLRYTPDADHVGSDQLDLRVDDLGHNGSGGAKTAQDSVAITVTAVNDAPVLALPGSQASRLAGGLAFSSAGGNAIALADVDAAAGALQLTLSTARVGNGTLGFGSLAGASLLAGTGSGDTVVVLQGTLASLNAALQTLTFTADASGAAAIDVALDDLGNAGAGGALAAGGSIAITVAEDPPPQLQLARTSIVYTENQGAVALDPGLVVSDRADYGDPVQTEGLSLASATVRIVAGRAAGQDELRFTADAATMGDIGGSVTDGTLTLVSASRTATLAQWRAALRVVTYANESDAPQAGTRTVAITVNDGKSDSAAQTIDISVTAVNDAPLLAGAGDLPDIAEDVADADNGGVSVAALIAGGIGDADAGAARGVAVVAADDTHGTWQYRQAGDPGWSDVGGVADGSALLLAPDALLRFVPDADWNGSVVGGLVLRAWDQTTGSAGTQADTAGGGGSSAFSAQTAALSITVVPVDDAPAVTGTLAPLTATEDTAFSYVVPAGLISDIEAAPLAWTAALADGSALPAWLAFDGATRTLAGTPGNDDVDRITVRLSASDGSAGAFVDVQLTVLNVNDAPTLVLPLPVQNATEGTPFGFVLPDGSFEDIDRDSTLSHTATLASGAALPAWLQFDAVTQTFSGTPDDADVGTITVRVTANDGSASASGDFTLTVANVNDAPTGSVTIIGTAQQGQTLTAADTLADADGLGAVSYQWFADGVAVGSGATLTLTQAQVGAAISVVASYTDGFGQAESVASAATGAVANVNDAPTGDVTITGVAEQGQTLTAANTLADADGLGAVSYQWFADGVAVASGSSLTLTQAQVGRAISVVASYSDAFGQAESVASAATGAVANVNDAPIGSVAIVGTAQQGQALTAANTLADADGLGAVSYQWFADGVAVASGSSLTLAQAQVGKAITVVASYVDAFGQAESVTSAATGAVANVNDAPTGDVTITGAAEQGQTLIAANTVADADGLGAVSYQWFADGLAIGSGATLTLTQAQVGAAIRVVASYIDGFGQTESVASAATATVANVNDAPTGDVTITGGAEQGQTLTAANTLADADGLGAVTYQWFADGVAVGSGATLTLTQAQVAAAIRVVASYTDGFGQAESVASAATGAVANVNDAPIGTVTITGVAEQGQTLTAVNTLADADGLGAVTYQWFADGVAVGSGATLTLTQAQVAAAISVVASYTDGFGQAESVASAATGAVANVNDLPTGIVTITGAAEQGQTLSAANTLADADGLGAVSYQWFADGVAVASGSSLTLTQAQVGKAITVVASYVDGFGQVESVASAATGAVANVNDAPIGGVAIVGTAQQGQALTAANTLADADGLGAVSYQWFADGVAVASGSSLTLAQAQVGKAITVVASYVDAFGQAESVTSAATGAVANVNDAPTGDVTITGAAEQGQTLIAANTVADADGLGAVSYQWFADGLAIGSGATLTLTQAQVGAAIRVVASYIDGFGQTESVASAATATVANVNDAPTGDVTITGGAEQGQTLTAANTLADADGLGAVTYQWFADGVAVGSGATLTLTQAQVGAAIRVVASYIDGFGQTESVASAATATVANVNDAPTGDVTITGGAEQGQTLTAANTLADADGLGAVTYQWFADGVAVGSGATLTLTQAQVGAAISVVASYTDGFGQAESVASAAIGAVANVNDLPTGIVTITGSAEQGQTLTAANTLADADGLGAVSYQWFADGVAVASGSSLTLTQAQVGKAISVVASYVDGFGQIESVASAATGAVANVNDAPTGGVAITGTAQQGWTLVASDTLADVDGLGAVSYQWFADGLAVGSGATLALTQVQVGKAISVVASYVDAFGQAESVASAATAAVANVNDAPAGSVAITGTAQQGWTLVASDTLADADGLGAVSYQWFADGLAVGSGTSLALTQSQVGKAISVVASYVDGFGQVESVASATTGAVANVNDAPIGTVTITGVAEQGQTLVAANTLADADGLGAVSYQWLADGVAVASGSSLTLTQAQVGKAITVVASYVDGFGQAESVASAATGAVANVNDAPTGGVAITGTAQQGWTLVASDTLADVDGLGAVSYQWFADGLAVGSGSTLTLTQVQVGKAITVVASYTDAFGQAESVASAATGAVSNINDAPTGGVTIIGTAQQGQTLTAADTLVDADGLGAVSYQWFADGLAVGSGTTLALTQAQVGKAISVVASYVDGFGQDESVASAATGAVANVNDAPTGSVAIIGTAQQGQTLTAGDTLVDADGLGAVSYQWFADGLAVGSGTSLALTQSQVGKAISVVASYVDGFGQVESVASATTAAVTNVNDAPIGTVTITGVAEQGQTLIAANTLADADGLGAVSYQWFADGVAVASGSSLMLTQAQVAAAISVVASYTDGFGQTESVASATTGAVANVNDAPIGTVTITGVAEQGQTLSAANTLADADGLGAVTYQWFADGVAVGSGATLTLTQAQVGAAISVVASYTDGFGQAESVASAATGAVANVNDAPIGGVAITGTAQQGWTLVASDTLADADGLGTIAYQWFADGVAVASGSSLALAQAQVGEAISVVASYVDAFGQAESVASAAIGAVANVNDLPTGIVTITGAAEQGQTLTATNTLADADGLGAVSYQWLADGVAVASGSSLTLAQAQVGKAISVVASYVDGFGATEAVASAATATVANVDDTPTGAVSITGVAEQGRTLLASATLADADGLGALRYEWFADGVAAGTGASLALTQAHVGHAMTVTARYDDGFGHPESVASAATAAVADIEDAPTGGVTITGIAEQGQTLTAADTLADADGLGPVAYAWFADGVAVASGATLTLTQAHVGHVVTAVASYVDGFGRLESARSAGTAAVADIDDTPTGSIVITGIARQGETLVASDTLADDDGLGAVHYQWLAEGLPIAGATGATLSLSQAHVGRTIGIVASYADGAGRVTVVTGRATAVVADLNDAPRLVHAPDDQRVGDGQTTRFALAPAPFADDDAGDALHVSATLADGSPLPAWLRFDAAGLRFEVAPAAAQSGAFAIRVVATDAGGLQADARFVLTVIAAPVAVQPDAPAPAPAAAAPVREDAPAAAPAAEAAVAPAIATPAAGAPAPAVDALFAPPAAASPAESPAMPRAALPDIATPTRPGSRADAVLGDVPVPEFRSIDLGATLQAIGSNETLRRLQDTQRRLQQQDEAHQALMTSSLAAAGGLSIGYVVWLLRGGVLVSSMLSALPAWQMIDPLPVVAAAGAARRRAAAGAARARDDEAGRADVERLFDEPGQTLEETAR